MKGRHSLKLMSIIAERDTAFQERNAAIAEKKAALAERDLAIMQRDGAIADKKAALSERDMATMQRDSAIAERNSALMERDAAIAALEYTFPRALSPFFKQEHHPQLVAVKQEHQPEHVDHPSLISDSSPHDGNAMPLITEAIPISVFSEVAGKPERAKRKYCLKAQFSPMLKTSVLRRKNKKCSEDLNKQVFGAKELEWNGHGPGGDDPTKLPSVMKYEWRGGDLELNGLSTPVPVCSCTGDSHQCYKWGNGGWQSACCTTSLSMYPLPLMPNKRHARVGGRKMTGSAFAKLLCRLAGEGHDLSLPVDLKDHWAKHGTNGYITIK